MAERYKNSMSGKRTPQDTARISIDSRDASKDKIVPAGEARAAYSDGKLAIDVTNSTMGKTVYCELTPQPGDTARFIGDVVGNTGIQPGTNYLITHTTANSRMIRIDSIKEHTAKTWFPASWFMISKSAGQ